MADDKKSATTSIVKVGGAVYFKVTGRVQKDEMVDLEQAKSELEQTREERKFIFDFSAMEDAIVPAVRILIQMQVEARKKGSVYVLTPNTEMLGKLKDAGAVRESELIKSRDQLIRALKGVT
ncbi:MAG: hypothetical protein ACLGHN_14035 [Bacteriovoracia bacterium]